MVDVAAVWNDALPKIREAVSGVGVWAALNAATPITFENGEFVIGLPPEESQLAGHLRVANTRRTLDVMISRALETQATVRIINGSSAREWEMEKRRDEERRRLQEAALTRERARIKSTSSWEELYVQLGRSFSQMQNRRLKIKDSKIVALSEVITQHCDCHTCAIAEPPRLCERKSGLPGFLQNQTMPPRSC
jgi:hypothetical protein